MRKLVLIALVVFFVLTSPLLAQQEKGDLELQLQGALWLALDDAYEDIGVANVRFGKFLTDRQEIGGTILAVFNGDGDIGGTGGPFWRFNFTGNSKTVPYVGAAVQTGFGEFYSESDVLATLEGGVRWFLQRNMAFTVGAQMDYDVDESEFSDYLGVLFGFSYFWEK